VPCIIHLDWRYCRYTCLPKKSTNIINALNVGFVAYVLTHLPSSELEDRVFRLEGDRASLNDLAPLFKTTSEHVDEITGEGGESKTILMAILESGLGSTGWGAVTKAEGSGIDAAGSANAL
jgi:hypothetical protein